MTRFLFASLLIAASAVTGWQPAIGQAVQYQFTPPPPIVPLPETLATPAPIPGVGSPVPAPPPGDVTPQVYVPPPSARALRSHGPRFVQGPNGRAVAVPSSTGRGDYGTRFSRCMQAGSAAGIRGSGRLNAFGMSCAAQ
jgi:hypothetical protein